MACTVVFLGGDKLTFELEPDDMAELLASTPTGPGDWVKIDRGGGPIYVNRDHILFIRPLDYGEVATP
jgi:hypothetical protein